MLASFFTPFQLPLRRRLLRLATGAPVLWLAACAYDGITEPAPDPTAAYDLLFETTTPMLNDHTLMVQRLDTGARSNLFGLAISGGMPSVSANGQRVVYVGLGTGQQEYDFQDLFVVTRGGLPQRIVLSPGSEYAPSISPDGQRIAYIKIDDNGVSRLYVADIDGRRETPVTFAIAPGLIQSYASPAWSPDGSKLLFSAGQPGLLHLWIANADASNPRQITNAEVSDIDGAWSPDGTALVFVRTLGVASNQLMIRHLTTGAERSFNYAGRNRFPSWSPDGQRIAFVSNMTDLADLELFTVRPDGASLTRLTDDDVRQQAPRWIRR